MRYIVTRFDGWNYNFWIIGQAELNNYNDGSFENTHLQDKYKYHFYELGNELTELPFTTKNDKSPNP